MTSGKMPLILENPMGGDAMQVDLEDVDDLFGDAAALALPSRPASKRLRQRLDDLRQRGCCQYVLTPISTIRLVANYFKEELLGPKEVPLFLYPLMAKHYKYGISRPMKRMLRFP